LLVLFFLFSYSNLALAQTSPTESQTEKEKAKKELEKRVLKMLDDAVGDAGTLKLAQNRAVVYAIAGDLYWKFDEKRARELFRNAANDILAANVETEKERKASDDLYSEIYNFEDNNRSEILPLIAKHDADFALDLLVQTRSTKLADAMAKAAQPTIAKPDNDSMSFNPEKYRVRAEVALEQSLALQAAEQNPDKAIKLLKESLAKGISNNVLRLLQKINKKSEKKATELADEIVRKIADMDLTKNREDFGAAIRLLLYSTNPNTSKTAREKQFNFSTAQLKELAGKIADTFLQPSGSLEMTMAMSQVLPSLEKLAPEKIALLKQKQEEAMKNLPPEFKKMQQNQRIWNPNSTPEEIFAVLPKLNEYEKAGAYEAIVDKIGKIDDEARAKNLIEQIPDEKARDRATEKFESSKISRTAKDGKLDEAKKLIGNLSKKKIQIQKLVALATEFYKKDTEKDRETAVNLMKDARKMTNEYPEDEDELNDLMELVKGYATVNSNEGYRIFEPFVDTINDFVQASATLSKFNKRSQYFKKGELLMRVKGDSWDGLLLFRYINQIQLLGKADLNRMSLVSDKFGRTDARTLVKLFVAQGFLKEDKKDDEDENSGDNNYYFGF
jgi:hypothetical protein